MLSKKEMVQMLVGHAMRVGAKQIIISDEERISIRLDVPWTLPLFLSTFLKTYFEEFEVEDCQTIHFR